MRYEWILLGLLALLLRSSGWTHPITRVATKTLTFSTLFIQKDGNNGEKNNDTSDSNRRLLLKQSSAALAGTMLGQSSSSANAAMQESDKVVFSTRTENDPVKFVDASATAIKTPMTRNEYCLDSEEQRINVFERTAPSVVFIDTFKEQRDVFSTNV